MRPHVFRRLALAHELLGQQTQAAATVKEGEVGSDPETSGPPRLSLLVTRRTTGAVDATAR